MTEKTDVNEYHVFLLKSLLTMLNQASIDALKDPEIMALATHGKSTEDVTKFRNNNVALYNLGVMRLRRALREALIKEATYAQVQND